MLLYWEPRNIARAIFFCSSYLLLSSWLREEWKAAAPNIKIGLTFRRYSVTSLSLGAPSYLNLVICRKVLLTLFLVLSTWSVQSSKLFITSPTSFSLYTTSRVLLSSIDICAVKSFVRELIKGKHLFFWLFIFIWGCGLNILRSDFCVAKCFYCWVTSS